MFADADLPGKFAEDVIRIGVGSLKVLVDFAEIVNGSELDDGKLFADAYVVPVAVIFREIVRGFVRIEEDIFVPVIADALDRDAAPLKSDDFVVCAAKLATSAQGDERRHFARDDLKFLQDLEIGVLRVQDRVATFANHGFGVPHGTKNDRRATLRTVQGLYLRLRRIRE